MIKYPKKLTEKETRKVKFSEEQIKRAEEATGVTFVVTYHPLLRDLKKAIIKNLTSLYMNEEIKLIISNYLVRATLYPLYRVIRVYYIWQETM